MNLQVQPSRNWFVVVVAFQNGSGKEYEYRSRDETIKEGDLAVVEVDGQFKCVDVKAVKGPHEQLFQGRLKWIVQKLSPEQYIAIVEEELAIEKEEQEINRLAIEHRRIKAVQETFADNPDLKQRFEALLARKRAL